MSYRSSFCLIFFVLINCTFLFAQPNTDKRPQGSVTGEILDANANVPIEYANIVLYNARDSVQVTGTVTGKDGKFTLNGVRPGNFYLEVHFIGYEKKRIRNISIKPTTPTTNVGRILIKPSAITTKSVVVEGERSPVTYNIDKKVIDVSKMGTVTSGNAADVLENVPSVAVDVEGNVSLRGSGNFTVLVDGRPSVMSNQDILQQIPASSIQSIEIVTNPSAKYDPEGTAGIINVILKKNQNLGLSGVVNGNAGLSEKYGGDFLFQYKTSAINYSIGLDYNQRTFPGDSRNERRFFTNNSASFINSNGNSEMVRNSFGMRGALDFNLGEKDLLTLGGRFGNRKFDMNSNQNFSEWSNINNLQSLYLSKNNSDRSGDFYAFNTNYTHKFEMPKHEFALEMFLSHNNSDESTISSQISNLVQFNGKKTTESGPETHFRGKLDYTLPLSDKAKFEAGSQGEIETGKTNTGNYEFNPLTNSYDFLQKFSNNIKSNNSNLALYTIYSNEWGKFGLQGGIRSEYTYRTIEVNTAEQKFNIDRWDYFPTVHTSFNFSEVTQLMASYTRRIDRPHDWQLEPFETWTDDKSVRRGNPDLKPQFIDSYEFGIKTLTGGISISNEFYYRFTKDRINFINSVYPGSDNITLTTSRNVGTDYSLGAELMVLFDPVKFWSVNLMGNLYNYKIEGALDNVSFARNSFNWTSRMNNIFTVSKSTQVQVNTMYSSPTVSSQGKMEGFFTTDVSVKQDFMERTLSLTLQLRNIFATAKREFTSEGVGFYNYNYFKAEAPVVMLNIRLNFNNYKNNDEHRQQEAPQESGYEGNEGGGGE